MSKNNDKFAKVREQLEACGWKNVSDDVIQQLRTHYILQCMLFDIETEYSNEEVADSLLSKWEEEE